MKTNIGIVRRQDILGDDRSSDREIFAAILRRWRQTLGYCSILAAVPAILASHVSEAHSDAATKPEANVAEATRRRLKRLKMSFGNPALLKRQSEYRLPHQHSNFDVLVTLAAGNDDCPGRPVPGGNYTVAAPYIDSGDTTGANSTVSSVADSYYYYYYDNDAFGPDHVYSFTLTGRGPNPQINITTTSNTYHPMVYILDGRTGCPAGTGNTVNNGLALTNSGLGVTGTFFARLNNAQMNSLPLNVPLHLFVDSIYNDFNGSGPYTVRMQDVTIASAPISNQIDSPDFFVRQHYLDFLNRQPDAPGLAYWTNEITVCANDAGCIDVKRVNVSAAFFLSIEFQETGYLVYKTFGAAFGATRVGSTVPLTLAEFLPDVQRVSQGVVVGTVGWEAQLEANQTAYFNEFVSRPAFVSAYPTTLTSAQFVDALNQNAGGALSAAERDQLAADLMAGAKTRAEVLRAVAEDVDFTSAQFNRAFVLMQYFGYLRRNPNDAPDFNFAGFNFWLNKLNQYGNYIDAEMVKSFIVSTEYR
ncbi:MAG: hypothetical protein ACR2HX_02345, partial [Pyrinomonadaceae bacterium]